MAKDAGGIKPLTTVAHRPRDECDGRLHFGRPALFRGIFRRVGGGVFFLVDVFLPGLLGLRFGTPHTAQSSIVKYLRQALHST